MSKAYYFDANTFSVVELDMKEAEDKLLISGMSLIYSEMPDASFVKVDPQNLCETLDEAVKSLVEKIDERFHEKRLRLNKKLNNLDWDHNAVLYEVRKAVQKYENEKGTQEE